MAKKKTTQVQLKKLKNISLGSKDFHKIIQTALDGVAIYRDRKIIFASERLCEISGYTKEELLSKNIFEFFPLSEFPKIATIVTRRETGEDLRGTNESLLIDSHGVHKNVELSSTIVMIDGKLSVISFIKDISQRKADELEIKRRLEFQEKVSKLSTQFVNFSAEEIDLGIQKSLKDLGDFASVPRCFIIMFSDDNQYIDSIYEWHTKNGSFQHSPEKVINLQDYKWAMNKIHADGIVYVNDTSKIPKSNSYIYQQLESREIRSVVMVPLTFQRKLIGIGGFCESKVDPVWSKDSVALLKVAGEMFSNAIVRKQNEQKIQELYKTQSILYSQIAHSLRTTFAVVLGNLEMLNRPLKTGMRSELVSTIKESVSNANAQLKQLFEIARVNSMPKHSGTEVVSIKNLFTDLEKQTGFLFRSYFPEEEASEHLTFDYQQEAYLIADQKEILNGLLMLIDNALLHSPFPGEIPSVKVVCTLEDRRVNIEIIDHGKGIPENELPKVFEIFYRSESGGEGIGLAHSRKIIETHGGGIKLESTVGSGTKCIVTLPVQEAHH